MVAAEGHGGRDSEGTAVGRRLRSRQEVARSSVCAAGLCGSRSAVTRMLLWRGRRLGRAVSSGRLGRAIGGGRDGVCKSRSAVARVLLSRGRVVGD